MDLLAVKYAKKRYIKSRRKLMKRNLPMQIQKQRSGDFFEAVENRVQFMLSDHVCKHSYQCVDRCLAKETEKLNKKYDH